MNEKLVILGGMGPQASLRLHKRLLDFSRQSHDGAPDSFPAITHFSMQIPDFIASTQMMHVAQQKLRMACGSLDLDEVSAVGMACNTAHLMVPQLNLPPDKFVSMVEAVVREIRMLGSKRVGLLASPHTLNSGLFRKELAKHDIDVVLPNKNETELLSDIIHGVIRNEPPENFKQELNEIGNSLVSRGADTLLLGCTELPIVGIQSTQPIVDSIDALAKAMLAKHHERAV